MAEAEPLLAHTYTSLTLIATRRGSISPDAKRRRLCRKRKVVTTSKFQLISGTRPVINQPYFLYIGLIDPEVVEKQPQTTDYAW